MNKVRYIMIVSGESRLKGKTLERKCRHGATSGLVTSATMLRFYPPDKGCPGGGDLELGSLKAYWGGTDGGQAGRISEMRQG